MKFNHNCNISRKARIGKDVLVGDNTIIYDNVEVGDNTIIANNCVIGEPLSSYYYSLKSYKNPPTKIGPNSLVRSHSIIYAGSSFGSNFQTGHRVTIREHSFIGDNCSIGTLSDIQGYITIGNYCRLHSNVHIGQKSRIGNFVFIYPYVVLTNDPTPPSNVCLGPIIGDYAQIATGSVILPGIKIGENALVGAGAIVTRNVANMSLVLGNPAKYICKVTEIKSREKNGSHYPWMHNFNKGMPWGQIGYTKWLKTNLIHKSRN